ncbi:hypothetical protein V8C37DRAFT_137597 [Trichoderma ceciliae]
MACVVEMSIFGVAQKFAAYCEMDMRIQQFVGPCDKVNPWSFAGKKFFDVPALPRAVCFSQSKHTSYSNRLAPWRPMSTNAYRRLVSAWFVTCCHSGCFRLVFRGSQGLGAFGAFQTPSMWSQGYALVLRALNSISVLPNLPCVSPEPNRHPSKEQMARH